MARVGVSITKSVAFRNSTQEFSNVYYFENSSTLPDQATAETLIDSIVTIEKTFHSSVVTFVRGRCWSQQGVPSANNMIAQKNLSGTGSRTADASMDRERAFLVQISAGVDSRGNPVKLRKWFHSCGQFFSGQSVGSSLLGNTGGFSSGDRTSIANAVDPLRSIGIGGNNYNLCSKNGRPMNSGANFTAHPFLEHHQLGDQWRAQ